MERIRKILKNRFVSTALPFFVFVVGGSFVMTKFTSIRYEYRNQKTLTPEEVKEAGISMKKPSEVTIERQFEKIKKMDIDTWENIRGPRPWEEDNSNLKSN